MQPFNSQNINWNSLFGIRNAVLLYVPEPFMFSQSHRDVQSGDLREKLANKPASYGSERVEHTLAKKINSADGEKLKVIVLSHSHVDPGWLVTFEQYYKDKVVKIMNNIVKYLDEEPSMKMIWSEISFLERWWQDASNKQKTTFKKLIANGQLEITGGGWVMTDEASPYYWATIDNLITGHQFLNEQLSVKPSSAWSNDPFGHGATVPYLMKLSGVNATTIDRVDGKVKASMREDQQIIFQWRQHWDNTEETDSLVHLLPYFYTTSESCGPYMYQCCAYDYGTSGFCPVKPITSANIDEATQEIGKIYRKLATYSGMPVLLVILGNDFRFLQPSEWEGTISNYQLIFKRLNEKHNFDINFGTLTEFFDAARQLANKHPTFKSSVGELTKPSLPILSGDFFPNWDQKDVYWTSYFVTHMFGKRMDRIIQSELRTTDLMISLLASHLNDKQGIIHDFIGDKLEKAHRNLALFQHHDAITGTSRSAVMDDYYSRLDETWNDMKSIQASVLNSLISNKTLGKIDINLPIYKSILTRKSSKDNFEQITINLGDFTEKLGEFGDIKRAQTPMKTLITVFNSMPLKRQLIVRLRVDSPFIEIINLNASQPIQFQLNPVITAKGLLDEHSFEIAFQVFGEPLAVHLFEIQRRKNPSPNGFNALVWTTETNDINKKSYHLKIETLEKDHAFIGTDQIKAMLSEKTGLIQSISKDGKTYEVNTEFWTYDQAGGQYIMKATNPQMMKHEIISLWKVEGPITTDFYAFPQSTVRTVFSVINADPPFEYSRAEDTIFMDILPNMDGLSNTLLTMRLGTQQFDAPSRHQYYSDSNGFQLFPRRYLPDVSLDGNLFPTGAAVLVHNDKYRLNTLTAQPHGVSRLNDGRIELLVDEVVSGNDDKGLETGHHTKSIPSHQSLAFMLERLKDDNETDYTPYSISLKAHQVLNTLLYPAVVTYSMITREDKLPSRGFEPLPVPLPCQVQLLNIRPISQDEYLMILRRIPNDPGLDQDQVKRICGCFLQSEDDAIGSFIESLGVANITETSLTGTRHIRNVEDVKLIGNRLSNMQIATFKVLFKKDLEKIKPKWYF